MPQQPIEVTQNKFTQGLRTEYTGLNFPENAATETDNCIFELTGNVTRRLGIDLEENYNSITVLKTLEGAKSSYLWTNAGGDGNSTILVTQNGVTISFFLASEATTSSPVSNHALGFYSISEQRTGDIIPTNEQCQYTDGNGYLFIFNKYCNPVYVIYEPETKTLTFNPIYIKVRDLIGASEVGVPDDLRPSDLSAEHLYNLLNQGWVQGSQWAATSNTPIGLVGGSSSTIYFTINETGLPINVGDQVKCINWNAFTGFAYIVNGIVLQYYGNTLVVNPYYIYSSNGKFDNAWNIQPWKITPTNSGYIEDWHSNVGNYPSNADVWWYYKNAAGEFSPATTYANVSASSGPAPKGHFLLDAFRQQRTSISGVNQLSDVITDYRPSTGAWFAGRIWYAGVDDSTAATSTNYYYTWTENIYFSQIVLKPEDLSKCYQQNDLTSEKLFDLLPTDGGVLSIQGCGSIYKLFPIQNGLLVFAANGIWFVTGNKGIGFTANDYTVTQISEVRCMNNTSFINVNGLPYFWNEEGIYTITPSQQGLGLIVSPITLDTILTFYLDIPRESKQYVKGSYNPLDYTIQWLYRDVPETNAVDRYYYNKILVYNTFNKSFYTHSIEGTPNLHSINYVPSFNIPNSPEGQFKYWTSLPVQGDSTRLGFTFSDFHDENYVDWHSYSTEDIDYESYFITGYGLHGKAIRKFQVNYIYTYSDSDEPNAYKIQGIWDYARDRNSGKWTSVQLITNALTRFSKMFRRHRIRGRGISLQLKISSVSRMPFSINGWAVSESQNANT